MPNVTTTSPMRLIPVVDILGGQVVHATGGQRENYAPIQSRLVASTDPAAVASALWDVVDTSELYVADVGALQGHDRDWPALSNISSAAASVHHLWIDMGIVSAEDANLVTRQLTDVLACGFHLIVALETIIHFEEVERLFDLVPNHIAFSLDLCAGRLQVADPTLQAADPLEIVDRLWHWGCKHLVVLDTSDVGHRQGPSTLEMLNRIHKSYPQLRLIGGGGVRGRDDVRALQAAGCDGVLVATALHRGSCPDIVPSCDNSST